MPPMGPERPRQVDPAYRWGSNVAGGTNGAEPEDATCGGSLLDPARPCSSSGVSTDSRLDDGDDEDLMRQHKTKYCFYYT